jgi:hypothetical protein
MPFAIKRERRLQAALAGYGPMLLTGTYAALRDDDADKRPARFTVRGAAIVLVSLVLVYSASLSPLLASRSIHPAFWIGMTFVVTLILFALRTVCLYSIYALRILFALVRG